MPSGQNGLIRPVSPKEGDSIHRICLFWIETNGKVPVKDLLPSGFSTAEGQCRLKLIPGFIYLATFI